jgi:uncharacterized protein (TIGR03118 family)
MSAALLLTTRRRGPFRLLAVAGLATLLVTGLATAAPAGARANHDEDNRYQQLNLVSDQVGKAQLMDSSLVNAWGLAAGTGTRATPIWVSNNGTSTSTLYRGATTPGELLTKVPLTVSIPGMGSPTGVVFNGGPGFVLSTDGKTGPALFIFAGEGGEISAWNPTGTATMATLVVPSKGGVYKGLALVTNDAKQFLLAANFHDNRIDIFNSSFAPVSKKNAFRSVRIPSGYAPFDVAVLGNRVYVSYAKQNAEKHDDLAGPGRGFVNVFTTEGKFLRQFARRGVLNSPWGLTIAPKGFGEFTGDILIGNFGDGRIYAFDPRSGELEGTLRGTDGQPLVIDGLWALMPGNGVAGATSDLWFSAGPAGETHGLLGILRAAPDD